MFNSCVAINKEKPSEISRFQRIFGPSDRVRTCGLMVPNHPRYQLRYTRLFNSKVLLSVVIPVVKTDFSPDSALRRNPESARVARRSGLRLLLSWIGGAALPNHPRYQLRHTRLFNFSLLLSVVIPVVKADFSLGSAFW